MKPRWRKHLFSLVSSSPLYVTSIIIFILCGGLTEGNLSLIDILSFPKSQS